jgi:hypothetical protein
MSDVLDRIRHELQQRLESTRAAAHEHERVKAALEALEHATKPLERATRQVAGEASRRSRSLAARARPTRDQGGSAATGSDTEAPSPARPASTSQRRAPRSRKPGADTGARRNNAAPRSTAKTASAASKRATRSRSTAKPARARAPRGANREAVLAVVRERPGVTASELAVASGVTGGTLYALLRRLTEQGELDKRELPGGQVGYRLGGGGTAPTQVARSEPRRREPSAPTTGAEVAASDESRTAPGAANSGDSPAEAGTANQ